MKGNCRLCGNYSTLKESHIIPAFIFRWFKDSSATGYLRYGMEINKRVQDGIKLHWLCEDCEGRFGEWEKCFSEKIFMPLNKGEGARFTYGPWMLKFAVSVSWRVLSYLHEMGLSHFSSALLGHVENALDTWREFLLDKCVHPDGFEQHMLLMDLVDSHSINNLPPNMNRYLLRTVEINSACRESQAFVYTKMCRVMLVGFINIDRPRQWQGSKLHLNHGKINSQTYTLPDYFRRYIFERARKAGGFNGKVSAKQASNISTTYRQGMQRATSSETWRALDQDVLLSGSAAFSDESSDPNDGKTGS